jgi:hypothetical protein
MEGVENAGGNAVPDRVLISDRRAIVSRKNHRINESRSGAEGQEKGREGKQRHGTSGGPKSFRDWGGSRTSRPDGIVARRQGPRWRPWQGRQACSGPSRPPRVPATFLGGRGRRDQVAIGAAGAGFGTAW